MRQSMVILLQLCYTFRHFCAAGAQQPWLDLAMEGAELAEKGLGLAETGAELADTGAELAETDAALAETGAELADAAAFEVSTLSTLQSDEDSSFAESGYQDQRYRWELRACVQYRDEGFDTDA